VLGMWAQDKWTVCAGHVMCLGSDTMVPDPAVGADNVQCPLHDVVALQDVMRA
jgi:hypothetical protein